MSDNKIQQVKEEKIQKNISVFVKSLIDQAKKNKIELNHRHEFDLFGKTYVLSAIPEFRKYGTSQVVNFNSPIYNNNKEAVLATFKVKLNGNPVSKYTIQVKHAMGLVPSTELVKQITIIKESISKHIH